MYEKTNIKDTNVCSFFPQVPPKKKRFIACKAIPMIAFHRVKSCVTHVIEHALKLYRQAGGNLLVETGTNS